MPGTAGDKAAPPEADAEQAQTVVTDYGVECVLHPPTPAHPPRLSHIRLPQTLWSTGHLQFEKPFQDSSSVTSLVCGIISWYVRAQALGPYLGPNAGVPTDDLCALGKFLSFSEP